MRFRLKPWQVVLLWVVLGIVSLLAGCADAPPTPTPIVLVPDTSTQDPGGALTPALTPGLSPAPTRTFTPGPSPTASTTPSPTATPTFTPTPTPTLTPSPTPQPSAQLEAARRHQINGDYGQAILAYLALLDAAPTPDQAREAHYHLAELYLLNHEYAAAAAAWDEFIRRYPDDARLPQATLMGARAFQAANDCAQAVSFYQAYLSQETVLADMVHERIGDCLSAEGRQEEALIAYRQALDATQEAGVQVGLREKLAGIYLAQQDYAAALAEYDAILAGAKIDAYRARIEYLAGQALIASGDTEAAHARYRRAVNAYPEAEYAYLSLVELVDAGVEVDEFQRGLVDYHAGAAYHDVYGAALRAFDRYLAGQSPPKADAALYYKALTQRAVGQPEAALETLESLISGYPESAWLVRAWLQKGVTLASMGRHDAAIKAYQDLAAFFPGNELAPDALWRAARLREDEGAYQEAGKLYEGVQSSFPALENADEALWRAGFAHYRAGDPENAIADWQSLVDKYPASTYHAKSLYWLGKLGAKPESEAAADFWDQLVEAHANTYYALRVEQIRAGDSLTVTRLITAPIEPPVWDAAEAGAEILSWLRGWTQVPTDTQQLTLPLAVTGSLDFRRGEALLAAGLRREALGAFDNVRAAAWDDPLRLAQLGIYLHERGLYGLAARCAARLAVLGPKKAVSEAPEAVQRLAYPLVYTDLLSAEAQERGLDPLLLAALIRQESLFEPAAESYAGARGLGQVMPATGEGIARTLGMEDFQLDDLYRPHVSVKFGAFYLGVQMDRFGDQILIALAAYNGGPGNTLRWLELGGEDLDFFVEMITANQSRVYLQRVYESYLTYERLYRPPVSTEE